MLFKYSMQLSCPLSKWGSFWRCRVDIRILLCWNKPCFKACFGFSSVKKSCHPAIELQIVNSISNNTCIMAAYCWYWICNGQYLLDSLMTSTYLSILCQIHAIVRLTQKISKLFSPTLTYLIELKLDCSEFHLQSLSFSLFAFFFSFVIFVHFIATLYIYMCNILLLSFCGIPGVKSYGYGIIKNKNFL